MHTYFVDTAHWLALVSPRDSWNSTAKKLAAKKGSGTFFGAKRPASAENPGKSLRK